MKPSEIRETRGKLQQGKFCEELNKISQSLLPGASLITVRAYRNWETENKINHRVPPEWIRFVILQYKQGE